MAFAATVGIGLAALAASSLARLNQLQSGARPTVAISEPYVIDYRLAGASEFSTIRISQQGTECDTFKPSRTLFRACNLAVNVDAAWIAGDAQGRLNHEYTPSLEAIIWRGRLVGGPEVCQRSGLLDDNLRRCEESVERVEYVVSDAGIEIRVPSGWR